MTHIALVVSDVDGTLVTKDKVLTDGAKRAVQRLHEAGIGFTITSSRPSFGMRFLIEPLAITQKNRRHRTVTEAGRQTRQIHQIGVV